MTEIQMDWNVYVEMWKKIRAFESSHGRKPNYVDQTVDGRPWRIFMEDYLDAQERVTAFKRMHSDRDPNYVTITATSLISKTDLWLRLEKALGRTFINAEEMAEAFKAHPDYQYYYNDQKTAAETLEALARLGYPGVNCVDISQVVRIVLMDMKYPNVHIWRGKFGCGGHIWVTFGADNRVFDAAGMMKWKKNIGQYMCSGTPTELSKDPAWLLTDDGKT